MEQHIWIRVRTAARRMYPCHHRYGWCKYMRNILLKRSGNQFAVWFDTPPSCNRELHEFKKITERLSRTAIMRPVEFVLVCVCTYVFERNYEDRQ